MIVTEPTEETLKAAYKHQVEQYLMEIDKEEVSQLEKLNNIKNIRHDVYGEDKNSPEELFLLSDLEKGGANGFCAIEWDVFEISDGVIVSDENLEVDMATTMVLFAETKENILEKLYPVDHDKESENEIKHNESDLDYDDDDDDDDDDKSEKQRIDEQNARI